MRGLPQPPLLLSILVILSTMSGRLNVTTTKLRASILRLRQQVKEGDRVEMSCPSPHPWFLCIWRSPAQERQCGIQQNVRGLQSVCSNTRLSLSGNSTDCRVSVVIGRRDHGTWTCLLTLQEDFSSLRSWVEIRVATRPVLSLELVLGGKKVRVSKSSQPPTLNMIEGQTKEVTCRADEVYPKPTFLWTLGQSSLISGHPHPPFLSTSLSRESPSLATSLQSSLEPSTPSPPPPLSLPHPPAVERSHLHYWVSSSSSLLVTPSLLHNNTTLSCTTLPSSETISLPLTVEAYLPPQLHLPVPISSGPPLLHLLLLLLLPLLLLAALLCCFFFIRRRRREEDGKDCSDDVVQPHSPHHHQVVCSVDNSGEVGGLWAGPNCTRKVSVIGRTYRGSLPSQSGGHKEEKEKEEKEKEEKEKEEKDHKEAMKKTKEEEEEEENRATLEFGGKYKMGDKLFRMENGWEEREENLRENGESDLERREERESIYLGENLLESERSESLCSVCSRSLSPPPQFLLPASSSSSTPPPYHFSPSSPRPSLFECRECCFDNSPLSCQLVAIPAFPSQRVDQRMEEELGEG